MLLDHRPYTFDRVVRMALGALVCAGLLFLLSYLREVLVPFAVAFLLAYLLNPVAVKLQDWGIRSRLAAVLITLFLACAALGGAAYLIIPMIVEQIQNMGELVKNLVTSQKLGETASKYFTPETWQEVMGYLKSGQVQDYLKSDTFVNMLKGAAEKIIPLGKGFFSGIISTVITVTGLLVIGLYTVFLLLDFQKVRQDWQSLIPAGYRPTVIAFVRDFDAGMNRYFRAQAVIASTVAIIYTVGFQIIGLPLAILLGLLIALLGMIPYLRTLSVLPVSLLTLMKILQSDQSPWTILIGVVVVYAVAESVDGAFLTPRIMGNVTGFSPALIILSLSVWGKLLGLLGLLIALPMTCLLLAYYRRLLTSHDGETSDAGPGGGVTAPEVKPSPAPEGSAPPPAAS